MVVIFFTNVIYISYGFIKLYKIYRFCEQSHIVLKWIF
jgi:hypothetical protein